MSRECIWLMYCCICKSGQHLARTCHFSWHREREPEYQEPEPEFGEFRETVQDGTNFPAPGELLHFREEQSEDQPMEGSRDTLVENRQVEI